MIRKLVRSKMIYRIGFLIILISSSLSGCQFSHTLWNKHEEKAESPPISLGNPKNLFLNVKEKKICISYHPMNATHSAMKHLIVQQDSSPNAIGKNYDLQILNDIFSDLSHFKITSVIANAQKSESSDYFILFLAGKASEQFYNTKYSGHIFNTNEKLIDSPLVLKNHKIERLNFIYGAFQSNGRVSWIPTQGFNIDEASSCNSSDWIELPTKDKQFDLYFNTSKQVQVYDNPLFVRVLGTPLALVLDGIIYPFFVVYILLFFDGM